MRNLVQVFFICHVFDWTVTLAVIIQYSFQETLRETQTSSLAAERKVNCMSRYVYSANELLTAASYGIRRPIITTYNVEKTHEAHFPRILILQISVLTTIFDLSCARSLIIYAVFQLFLF